MNNEKKNNNLFFEFNNKIGNTNDSSRFIKHSKEGSTDGTNTLQNMLDIEFNSNDNNNE